MPTEIKESEFVTLVFAGDIMLDRGVRKSVVKNFSNDYSALFAQEEVSSIFKKSDIVFANLEGPVSDKGVDRKNLYSFRMDPAILPALKNAGIDIVSVANNHAGDWGQAAYIDTLARLKENGILYTGGGLDKTETEIPVTIEKNGLKIGFLGFSDKGPDYLTTNGGKAGVLLANDPNFDVIISSAAQQVDYLIVSFHFGEEYVKEHNARQEYLAHRAIDNGAKIVIGHHPQVIEDSEMYSRKSCTQSSCMSYIAYSLGNFLFDQSWSAPTMEGMILQLKLFRDGSISATKNNVYLNSFFQLERMEKVQEEVLRF